MRARSALLTAVVLTIAVLGPAAAQSWNAFSAATITGVTVTPSYADGTTAYTYALQPGATVNGLAVTQILGVFALGDTQTATFNATGSDVPGWNFTSSAGPTGYVAGWSALGAPNRINPGGSKVHNFTTFDITSGGVLPGWHLAYVSNPLTGQINTAFFKETGTPIIPEPSTLMLTLLGGGASGLLGLMRRRKA